MSSYATASITYEHGRIDQVSVLELPAEVSRVLEWIEHTIEHFGEDHVSAREASPTHGGRYLVPTFDWAGPVVRLSIQEEVDQ